MSPLANLGQVALDDDRLAAHLGEHFQQRVQVLVIGLDVEHLCAAIAIQRLDDDVLVFGAEGVDLFAVGRDQRRRHQVREVGDEQLFRRVADPDRIVDHQCLGVNVFQHVGGRDIGHVEWRILAHQHHIHGREIEGFHLAELVVTALFPPHGQRPSPRGGAAVLEAQILGQVVVKTMPAPLGLKCQHERAVRINVDRLDRVHLNRDG